MHKILTSVLLLALALVSSTHADQVPISSRYVLLGPVATDQQTRLTWERCSVGQQWLSGSCHGRAKKFTFAEAQKQAKGEWRVPTKGELESLVFAAGKSLKIDTEVFPMRGAEEKLYWTSEQVSATNAWYANFTSGIVDYRFGDYDFLKERFFVRRVTGSRSGIAQ